jgi:hypothetical protein
MCEKKRVNWFRNIPLSYERNLVKNASNVTVQKVLDILTDSRANFQGYKN